MPWKNIPLPRLTYKSVDESALPDAVGARLVDGFINEFGNIVKRPGLNSTVFVNTGEVVKIDGLHWWDEKDIFIIVSNGNIYSVTASDGTFSKLAGDTLQTSGKVSFAANATTLVMANGGRMVTYDGSANPAFVGDADAPTNVTHVAFLDQYIVALIANSASWQFSAVNDLTTWLALDIFTAESKPDDLVVLTSAYGEIHLFGKTTKESWVTGIEPAFVRVEAGTLETGCIAPDSLVNADGTFIWLDYRRRVVMLSGRTIKRISAPFDDEIRDISPVTDAKGMYISIGRRAFYILNFPTNKVTYAYDLTTEQWAEWGKWDSSDGSYNEFMCNEHAYAKTWDFHLMGDAVTGKVYKFDANVYQDAGATIRTLVRFGHVSHGTTVKKRSNEIKIRLKRGAGDTTGNEPKIRLRWRDDNKDWSNWKTVSLGKMGETNFILRLRRLGFYRTRQYELTHSENTDFILIGMEENIDIMRN